MQNTIRCCLIILLLVAVSGCGHWYSTDYRTVGGLNIYKKHYEMHHQQTAYVGQSILRTDVYTGAADVIVNRTASPQCDMNISARDKLRLYSFELKNHLTYPVIHIIDIESAPFYTIQVKDSSQYTWGVLISDTGEIYESALYSYDHQMLFYPADIKITPTCNFTLSAGEIKHHVTHTTKQLSFELVYSGKNDMSMNFLYREYTKDDLVRPAFSQNVTYQAGAQQLRFRGYVIQVNKATNESITYTILDDGLISEVK